MSFKMNAFRRLWAFREFIYGSVKREFQTRYRNSLLGVFWTVLNPLAMIFVYTIIFSGVMHARLPGVGADKFSYSIYLCSGILTWTYFTEMVNRLQNVFIENANLLKKINFPRVCLPIIAIINSTVSFSIIFLLFLFFLFSFGLWPGWVVISVLPVLLVQILLASGMGVIIGILNIFFRDVGHFFGIFLQFWFWATPIVYPVSILPDSVKPFILLNPMYEVVRSYQDVFVSAKFPDFQFLIYPFVMGLSLCALGYSMFKRNVSEIVDEL